MARTNKPERKVLGSLTGEIWTTRSAKVPRRKLPDGRTETGREIPEGHPEYVGPEVEESQEIEILIETEPETKLDDWKVNAQIIKDEEKLDAELEWEPAEMGWNPDPITIEKPEEKKDESIRGRQAPKTTKKDHDKIQDLFMGMAAVMDNSEYSAEDKVTIIARLFEGTTDVRVETAQYIMSARVYGLLALGVSVMLLMKGGVSGGLFENYRNMFVGPKVQEEPDVFGE